MKAHHYAEVAGVLLAAEAGFVILHRAFGGHYATFTHGFDVGVDLGLAVVWLGGAAAALLRRPFAAFFLVAAGAFASLTFGATYCLSADNHFVGVPFVLASALVAVALVRSMSSWPLPSRKHFARISHT